MSSAIIIHTDKRASGKTRGTVEYAGTFIGYAVERSRILRGTGGQRGSAWTATPSYPGAPYAPNSGGLGTRFESRHAAVSALYAFARAYPHADRMRRALARTMRSIDPPTIGQAYSDLWYADLNRFRANFDRGF